MTDLARLEAELIEALSRPFEEALERARGAFKARIEKLNAGPLDGRLRLLAALYGVDSSELAENVEACEFTVGDDLSLLVSVRMRRSVETVHVTLTLATEQVDTPFAVPEMECRNCGRSDDHVYCIRWMEWLRKALTRRERIG